MVQLERGSRVQQLDILRGLAILLVLWNHVEDLSLASGVFAPLKALGDRFGWTGVDLFFVLSGFLIGGLLFREIRATGRLNVFRFLGRRAFKIWPGYFVLLAYAIGHRIVRGNPLGATFKQFIPFFFQVQNYALLFVDDHRPLAFTWSLAVEEHFYLILPVGLLVLAARGREAVARLFFPWACFSIGMIALYRTLFGIFTAHKLTAYYFPTHLRIDALLFGVMCAHASVFHSTIWSRLIRGGLWWLLPGLILLLPMTVIDRASLYGHTAGYTLLYLGYGCLLLAVLSIEPKKGLAGRALSSMAGRAISTIGFYSYAIYLWHVDLAAYPVGDHSGFLHRYLSTSAAWVVITATYVAVAILSGVLMTLLIEKPALRLRERFLPARGRTTSDAGITPQGMPGTPARIAA